jgi:hypothetical protein
LIAALLLTLASPGAASGSVIGARSGLEFCLDAEADIIQFGSWVAKIRMSNTSEDSTELKGGLSIFLGEVQVSVRHADGGVVDVMGRGALHGGDGGLRRTIAPGQTIIVPLYIQKVLGDYVFSTSGPVDITVSVPHEDVELTTNVVVEPHSPSEPYLDWFNSYTYIVQPYSCRAGDEHVRLIGEFRGVEREEISRFIEWHYGGSTTFHIIQSQFGGYGADSDARVQEWIDGLSADFSKLDELSGEETYWSMYFPDHRPRDPSTILAVF